MNQLAIPKDENTQTNPVPVIWRVAGVANTLLVTGAFIYFGFDTVLPFVMGGLAGMLAGVLPAAVANKRGRKSMANASLLLCSIAGIIGGLILAVPAALLLISITLLAKRYDVQAPTQNVFDATGEQS